MKFSRRRGGEESNVQRYLKRTAKKRGGREEEKLFVNYFLKESKLDLNRELGKLRDENTCLMRRPRLVSPLTPLPLFHPSFIHLILVVKFAFNRLLSHPFFTRSPLNILLTISWFDSFAFHFVSLTRTTTKDVCVGSSRNISNRWKCSEEASSM